MNKKNSRISIQVSLSGYSFRIYEDDKLLSASQWQEAASIFNQTEFKYRYDIVEFSVLTPLYALFPIHFFDASSAKELLSEVVNLSDTDQVSYCEEPKLGSVSVFSINQSQGLLSALMNMVLRTDGNKGIVYPELHSLLGEIDNISDYNKVILSYKDSYLYLVIAQGKTLALANVFNADDFTTAQYFLFNALKKLQLNPEVTTLYFRTALNQEQNLSLYRYFKSVEEI